MNKGIEKYKDDKISGTCTILICCTGSFSFETKKLFNIKLFLTYGEFLAFKEITLMTVNNW